MEESKYFISYVSDESSEYIIDFNIQELFKDYKSLFYEYELYSNGNERCDIFEKYFTSKDDYEKYIQLFDSSEDGLILILNSEEGLNIYIKEMESIFKNEKKLKSILTDFESEY